MFQTTKEMSDDPASAEDKAMANCPSGKDPRQVTPPCNCFSPASIVAGKIAGPGHVSKRTFKA